MPHYKMKESNFETPPENIYTVDLVGIEEMQGKQGPYLRWRWVIAEIPEQEKHKGTYATSLTPVTPTLGNRFGMFLKVLFGEADVGLEGDTDSLIDSAIRVKGFIEHNPGVNSAGETIVYCNIKKLLEGTAQRGAGIGRQDLNSEGKTEQKPQTAQPQATATQQSVVQPPPQAQAETPSGDIPW